MASASYRMTVDCPPDILWGLMIDKVRHPDRYVPDVTEVAVLRELGGDAIERLMVSRHGDFEQVAHEIIGVDETTRTIVFKLVDDPANSGTITNILYVEDGRTELEYTLQWTPRPGAQATATATGAPDAFAVVKAAVEMMKSVAEARVADTTTPGPAEEPTPRPAHAADERRAMP